MMKVENGHAAAGEGYIGMLLQRFVMMEYMSGVLIHTWFFFSPHSSPLIRT